MKKIVLSACAVAVMSSLLVAGGDIEEVIEPVVEEHNGFYAGLGITGAAVRDSAFSVDWGGASGYEDRIWNVSFLAGYNYNKYIAAEGRYITSVAHEDSVEMSGWSLFVKPQYPVTEEFSLYALLGYGGVTVDGIDGHLADVDDSGFQWGLGASYMVMESVSLFFDYTWLAGMEGSFYNGASEIDVDEFTLGVNYHF